MRNFIKCGIFGWCLELLWTSLNSLVHQDYKLTGQTSLWMFPIYGMAALIEPLSKHMQCLSIPVRGFIYMNGIFSIEFLSGTLLKSIGICPWDYSRCHHNYHGVIRFDYAPLWFFTGLLYEKLLSSSEKKNKKNF